MSDNVAFRWRPISEWRQDCSDILSWNGEEVMPAWHNGDTWTRSVDSDGHTPIAPQPTHFVLFADLKPRAGA